MAIDIDQEEFIRRFGFDPFASVEDGPPPELMEEPQPEEPPVPPTPEGMAPMPALDGMPEAPPTMDASMQPGMPPEESPTAKHVMRRLVQHDTIQRLAMAMQDGRVDLGPQGEQLRQASSPKAFVDTYLDLLEDPSFKERMILYSQDWEDGVEEEDLGDKKPRHPEEMLRRGVLASKDDERREAVRVGATAAVDLSRMADLLDQATGKADGLNAKYRVDMVGLIGVARDRILRPLVEAGELDGASRFDEVLDSLSEDVVSLAEQGYHPNAVPLRVALQLRFEVDKDPALGDDTGFGRALRQLRGLLRKEMEIKVARSAGLTGSVSPAEFREAMAAHDQALTIAKQSEPETYRQPLR